jgi:hypothetical protein
VTGSNAIDNRGGGGGASTSTNTAGNGGSGRVIVRYLTAGASGVTVSATGATSATPTVDGSYSYFQFDGTGTLVVA